MNAADMPGGEEMPDAKVTFVMAMGSNIMTTDVTEHFADQLRGYIASNKFRSVVARTLGVEAESLVITIIDNENSSLLAVNAQVEASATSAEAAEAMVKYADVVAAAAEAGAREAGLDTTVTAISSAVHSPEPSRRLTRQSSSKRHLVQDSQSYAEYKRLLLDGEVEELVLTLMREWTQPGVGAQKEGGKVSEQEFSDVLERVMGQLRHSTHGFDQDISGGRSGSKQGDEAQVGLNSDEGVSAPPFPTDSSEKRVSVDAGHEMVDETVSTALRPAVLGEGSIAQGSDVGWQLNRERDLANMGDVLEQELRRMFERVRQTVETEFTAARKGGRRRNLNEEDERAESARSRHPMTDAFLFRCCL